MNVEAVSGLMSLDQVAPQGQIQPAMNSERPDGVSFGQLLQGGVSEVNETLQLANSQLDKMALNQPVSTHEVMITMEKAKLQLQLAIEVRNKLLEGYQEIMRMQL
ncbi:MAG: flagellar hook-basal body complex protein FliE [Phenylobacterium sp.]|jgi:flagellar hook-basal body complex protein FliE